MKKFALLLVALLFITGCSTNTETKEEIVDTAANQKIVDYFDQYDLISQTFDTTGAIYIFDDGTEHGFALSVIFTEEQSEAIDALAWDDNTFDNAIKIVEQSEDYTITNLNEDIPDQATLNQYVGVSLGNLMDQGCPVFDSSFDEHHSTFIVDIGNYELEVETNEIAPLDEELTDEERSTYTIKSVSFVDYTSEYYDALIGE